MNEEEHTRWELNNMLDELAQRQLYCNRERVKELMFSPEPDVRVCSN